MKQKKNKKYMKFKDIISWMKQMQSMNLMYSQYSAITISYRKNRNAKPIDLCHLLSMRVPTAIAENYSNADVVMFRVKTNDRGQYMVKIVLEG